MKKLFIVLILIAFNVAMFGQKPSMFKKVPKDLFTREITVDRTIQGDWIWRFGVQVTGSKFIWNTTEKRLDATFLNSFGPAVGFKHYYSLPDGTPASNWGVNGALLFGPDPNSPDASQLEITVNVNLFNMAAGPLYVVNSPNHWGFLLNANFNF